ncbi:MAG: hypothetical protein HY716_03045 [Planctomycetes bacterium]|nr:hypothetical protein [Planctomycetota bacterium]
MNPAGERDPVPVPMGVPGARRIAVVLSAVEPETVRALLRHLNPDERRDVLVEIARLDHDPPSREEVESALREFERSWKNGELAAAGGLEYARALAEAVLDPEERRQAMHEVESALNASPFGFLSRTAADRIAAALGGEHPQAAALVLAFLPLARAAEVLQQLPLKLQVEALKRLVTLDGVTGDALREVERGLEQKLAHARAEVRPEARRWEAVVELLGRVDPDTEHGIVQALEREDPAMADRLRGARRGERG